MKDKDQLPGEKLKVSQPEKTAAGMKAVVETMTHTFGKMGVVRGTRALLNLNQKGGIDCPSCAWPDPEDKRTVAEFCESGAKALADEAMSKKIGREFWQRHDIEELAQKDDYWLNAQGRLTEPVV